MCILYAMTKTSISNIAFFISISMICGQDQHTVNVSGAILNSSSNATFIYPNEQIPKQQEHGLHAVNKSTTNTYTESDIKLTSTSEQYTTTTADPNEVIEDTSTNLVEYTTVTESPANVSDSNTTDIDQFTDEPVTGSQVTVSHSEKSNLTRFGSETGETIGSTAQPSLPTLRWTALVTRQKLNVWPLWSIVMYRFPSTTPAASTSGTTNIAINSSLPQSKPAMILKYHTLPFKQDNKTCPFGYVPDMTYSACVHLCEQWECLNGGICYAEVDVYNQTTAKCRCEESFEKRFKGDNCERWEMGRVQERVITLGILVPLAIVLLVVYATLCNKVRRNGREVLAIQRDRVEHL